jgi:hypothetical protein
MTDYKMTDEKRKMLTEKLLGECWHIKKEPRTMAGYICEKCEDFIKWGSGYDVNGNRIFTSDADMLVVFRKIRDVGKWEKFRCFAFNETFDTRDEFTQWLFLDDPERACCLAAMFLEEQG